ncbi:MAG: hypothetical protein AABY53_00710 [Bdellovibrionota bacterium]
MNTFIATLFTLTTSFAFAGFFAEPFIGYKTEFIKLTSLTNAKTDIRASQPSVGLKLGYQSMLGVDINLAGEVSSGNASVSTQTESNKFSHKMASVQLGVNGLGLVKMYLGGAFLNEFVLQGSPGLAGFKLNGPSMHAGLQYKLFSFMSLGLQYNLNQYNSIEGTAYTNGTKTETYFTKIDAQDYSFYLSTSF